MELEERSPFKRGVPLIMVARSGRRIVIKEDVKCQIYYGHRKLRGSGGC